MSRCLSWKSFIPLSLLVSLLSSNALGGNDPTFNFAVFGGKSVSMSGGSYTDSYSGTASRVTKGEYKNGAVGTNSLQSCSISLSGNGTGIYGKALVGAGGNPATEICTNGGSQIYNNDSGTLPVAKDMTPSVDPGGGTSFGALHLTAGTQKTLSAGNYRYGSIALSGGAALTLSGEITLHVDGNLTLSGGSKIIVAGGPVTIYASGQKVDISGGSVINGTQDPKMLTVYGGAGLATVNLSGRVTQHFLVYAPNAAITLSGGQATFGSVIGNTVTLSGGASVHFPEITDADPPVITIISPLPGALLNIPAITVSGSVNKAVSSVTVNGKGAAVNGTAFTFTGLQLVEGTNTIEIRATDPAGDSGSASVTVTLDSMPPAAPVIAQPKTPTNVASVTVGGTAEPYSGVRVYAAGLLVGTAAADSSGNFNLPNVTLAEGPNMFTAAAVDAASNMGPASKPVTVVLDTTPPALTVSALSDGSYTSNEVMNIAGTATDSGGGIKALLVNGTPVPVAADGSFSYAVTLAAGTNRIEAKATDRAGNGTVDVRTINLDQKAPRLTVDSPADNSKTGNAPQKVSGSVDETSTVEVRLNGATQPVTMSGTVFSSEIALIPGINTIEVLATDLAGNRSSEKRTVVYDDQTPAVSISDPDRDTTTNRGSIVLRGTASDPYTAVSITINVDGQSFTPPIVDNRFEQSVAFTAEKSYPITVTAVNEVKRSSAAVRNVIYDITPPAVTVNAPTSPTNQAGQLLFGAMESGATVTVACATAAVGEVTYPTATTWQAKVSGFSADVNEITVTAVDLAGNTATVAAKIAYDVTAPTGTIAVDGGAAVTGASQAELTLTAFDSSGVLLMKFSSDGLTWSNPFATAATLPWDLGTGDGTKQIFVAFMDKAGNWSLPVTTSITLDTTPPVIRVDYPDAGSFLNTPQITVSGTVSEAVGSVTVNGASATVNGLAWSIPYTLVEGLNTLTVRAVDIAGNPAETTASATLDTVAPVVVIGAPSPGSLTSNPQVTVSGTVSEEFAKVTVNGVPAAVTGKSWSTPFTLSEGSNTLSVVATDRATNSGSASVTVTLDSTPPAAPVIAQPKTPTNAAAVTLGGTAEPYSTVRLFAAGLLVGTAAADSSGNFHLSNVTLAEGPNTFTATAVDAASNMGPASQPVTVVLDTKPPVITVSSPTSGSYTNRSGISLKGFLDDATAAVTVNGVAATLTDGAFDFPVTLAAGLNTFTISAVDPAGNGASAIVTANLDTVPPSVSLTSPVSGLVTNTAQVTVAGSVSKTDTSVTLNGTPVTVTDRSFSLLYTLVEGENTITVEATDRATNSGSASVSVTLDSQAPQVSLSAPAEAAAGANVQIGITASDNRGLTLVEVRANGVPLWSATPSSSAAVTDTLVYHVPPDLAAGSSVDFQAKGFDAAGNQGTASARIAVTQGASGPGYAQGKVFDDARGLLLEGADVSVTDATGAVQSGSTGADGGWFFQVPGGSTVARTTKQGYTAVERLLSVLPEQNSAAFDARLTPLSQPTAIGAVGGVVKSPLTPGSSPLTLELTVPAGALSADRNILLTPVSNQGLMGLLPSGWSPLAAVEIGLQPVDPAAPPADAGFASASTLKVPLPEILKASPPSAILALYDAASHRWTAKANATVSSDGASLTVQVTAPGQYVLATADPAPNAPAAAVPGEALAAATAAAVSFDGITATGRVVPQAAPPSAGLRAAGELILTARPDVQTQPLLTSGLSLTAKVTEKFDLLTGDSVQPAGYSQDIVLFRTPCVTNISAGVAGDAASPENLRTTFPVSPSRDFTIVDLMLGKVGVEIVPRDAGNGGGIMVGADGGRLLDADGNILMVPPGALARTIPVSTRTIPAATASPMVGSEFTLLGAVDVDFTRQLLAVSAVLAVPAPAGIDPNFPIVIAKRIDVKGAPKLKLVGMGRVSGAIISSDAPMPAQVAAPGITGTGSYFFLQARGPLGFAAGTVTDASGSPFSGALVSTGNGSLVDLSSAAGKYLLALPVGTFTATALDIYKNGRGSGTGEAVANQAAIVDLIIRMIPPQVASVTPADNAINVQPSVPVVVTFTKGLDRGSVNSSTLKLTSSDGSAVSGVLSFNPDATVVSFYPASPLKSETAYTITVAAGIKDLQGYPLGSDITSRFTVRKTTPPPMPAAGSITGTFPDADGFITVTATQGSAEPGNTVLLINDTTGEIVSVTPATNGSFTGKVRAQLGDEIKVVLMDHSGNQTLVSYITFKSDDGKYLVTAKGGKVEGEGGSLLNIPDGALVGPTVLKVTPVAQESLPHPVPNGGKFLGAVNLDSGGMNFQKPIEISIPAPAGMPDRAVPFLAQPQDLVNPDGTVEKVYVIVDSARVVGNRLTTACPPFDGVIGFGIFVFLYVDGVVGEDVTVAGYAYRDMDGLPGYTQGADQPIKGAVIRAPGAQNFVSYTNSTGHYATYGFTVPGACRNFPLTAIHPQTMNRVSANVMTCDAPYIVNNFNFRLADKDTVIPDKAPPVISITIAPAPGQPARMVSGTVPVGTKMQVSISTVDQLMDRAILSVTGNASDGTGSSWSPQLAVGTPVLERAMTADSPAIWRYDYTPTFSGPDGESPYFLPPSSGNYSFSVEARDAAGNVSKTEKVLRVLPPGDPPRGVDGPPFVRTIAPGGAQQGLPVSVSVRVVFSEPVDGVDETTLQLIDEAGTQVPVRVTTTVLQGQTEATLTPKSNLSFGTTYTIVVKNSIRDSFGNPSADGATLSLQQEFRTTFRTVDPSGYDLASGSAFTDGRDIALYNSGEKSYAYIAACESGWRVADVTDSTKPAIVASFDSPRSGVSWAERGVAVEQRRGIMGMTENIAYADGNQYGYVRFYDVAANPVTPPKVGQEKIAEAYSGIPGRIAIRAGLAYVATVGVGIQVIDIEAAKRRMAEGGASDGSSIIGVLDTLEAGYGQPNDISLDDDGSLGVVGTSIGKVVVADFTTPQVPEISGDFSLPGSFLRRAVLAPRFPYYDGAGNFATADLVVAGGSGKVAMIDVSTPDTPRLLGTVKKSDGTDLVKEISDIAIDRSTNIAFLTTYDSIVVVDIANPESPRVLNTVTMFPANAATALPSSSSSGGAGDPLGSTPAVAEVGGWVYLANQPKGMRVLSFGDVRNMYCNPFTPCVGD